MSDEPIRCVLPLIWAPSTDRHYASAFQRMQAEQADNLDHADAYALRRDRIIDVVCLVYPDGRIEVE